MKKTNSNELRTRLTPRVFNINGKDVYAYDKVSVFDETAIGVNGAKYQIVSFPSGASVSAHFHTAVREVFLIESGKGEITINGKAHIAAKGDIFLIQPKDSHALHNTGSAPFILHIFKWNEDPNDITWTQK